MPRLRIHRSVDAEFWDVLAWYAGLSPLAADNFAASFDLAMDKIQRRLTSHAPWRAPFRRIRLKRFPYLLIFHTDRRIASVLALVHERREPGRVLTGLLDRQEDFHH